MVIGVCTQVPLEEQTSIVQALLSLVQTVRVNALCVHIPPEQVSAVH
jgi:hypothetical protein